MHNFAAANKTFPPGVLLRQNIGNQLPAEWVYFLHYLLPYLEQEGYYAALDGPRFNLPQPWLTSAPSWSRWAPLNNVAIPGLLCPDDDLGTSMNLIASGLRLAKSNYLGIFSGLNDQEGMYSATNPPSALTSQQIQDLQQRHAVFRYEKGTPFAEITDGLSNTMAVAEYLKGVDGGDVRGGPWSNRAGLQMLFVALGPNSLGQDSLYPSFCPPEYNQPSLNLPCNGLGAAYGSAASRSRHPGGVNVVYCDGSAHFIPDNVTIAVWQSLGWINDGNTVTADF
jgi:prepilin-type processing-associated H-X9-DG protein